MEQNPNSPQGPARNQSHMNKRPPRLQTMAPPEQTPHMHVQQRPHEGEVIEYKISEGMYIDPLELPDSVKRPGYAYRWVAKSVLGSQDARVSRNYTIAKQAGWREVPGERAEGYIMSLDGHATAIVENGGLVLMERPQYIEDEARRMNLNAARAQLNDKLEEIGMAAPANVRKKLVSLRKDERPEVVAEASAVPE